MFLAACANNSVSLVSIKYLIAKGAVQSVMEAGSKLFIIGKFARMFLCM